jgi:succinylglutamate desuccinylase
MRAAGLLEERAEKEVTDSRAILAGAAARLPRAFDVRYRHPILPGDHFRMQPGFENFDQIEPGQLLARGDGAEIRSRWDARILMPLYQPLGNDGFFVVREFRPMWLGVSALLRRLRLDRIVHWLPGIKRHPERADTLVVDRKVARWRSLELLHLLGFRRKRIVGNVLLVSRRKHS